MAKSNLYRIKRRQHTDEDGVIHIDYVREPVKSWEAKRDIMRANNWTDEQYRKQYDLFKNKLRAYESFRRAHGIDVKTQSPQELLYKQARAKLREGADYEPSEKMQQIQSFSAVSITKGRKLAADLESTYSKRRTAEYEEYVSNRFEGLVKANAKAAEIVERVTDPVQREQALADYADFLEEQKKTGAIPESGEAIGSGTSIEFDINPYIK